MSLIKKPHELSVQTKIKALIYGQAGVGKTTLALSAPKPLLLDFDGGVHRVNYQHQCDTLQVNAWAECEQALAEDLSSYDSIIIDTGGKMLDFMAEFIIKQNSKLGKSNGALTLQGFGERKGMFRQFCKRVMMLNKHLIFIAHRTEQKVDENIRYIPLFGGSSYDDLVTELDLVGYIEAVGKKRVITFDPTDRNDGKNTCNLPTAVVLPTVVDEQGNALRNDFLQKNVIEPYIFNLQKRISDGSNFKKVIEQIKDDIEIIVDAREANDFIKRIDAYEHVANSKAMASALLQKKAKDLNLIFNKKIKKYEQSEV